jgi:phage tail tape-measure protein
VVVVLVLDSNAQADAVAKGFSSSSPDTLVQMLGKHVYAANTLGTAAGHSISKAEFDKLVAAGEG